MKEYHKIQTIFKRNPLTNYKTLLEGDYSIPEFDYLKDNTWVFTEKVDGTNIRVMWDGKAITFGGKSDNAQIPVFLINKLRERFYPKQFAEKFGVETTEVCLYGEGYGAKIQKGGGNYRQDQDFVLFDVLLLTSDITYDNIKICPLHKNLVNATLKDLTLLRDFVNPAIINTLKNKILNGQKTLIEGRRNIGKAKGENDKLVNQQENVISNQNSELVLKNTSGLKEDKKDFVLSAEKNKSGMEETEKDYLSLLTIAIKRAELEDCYVALATLQFIKQNEMKDGLKRQNCICEKKTTKWWLQRDNVEAIAKFFEIDIVPIIGEGTLFEMVEKTRKGFNSICGSFLAEGIVARPKTELLCRNGSRLITKIKHRDFK